VGTRYVTIDEHDLKAVLALHFQGRMPDDLRVIGVHALEAAYFPSLRIVMESETWPMTEKPQYPEEWHWQETERYRTFVAQEEKAPS
jgi:hypothetical protein